MTTTEIEKTTNSLEISGSQPNEVNSTEGPSDQVLSNDSNSKNLVGIDVLKIYYKYHTDDPEKLPNDFKIKNLLLKSKITMTNRAGYVLLHFNINKILGDGTPYSRDTSYYAEALMKVEEIVRRDFDGGFSMDKCQVSLVELHRTFRVNEKPLDYYSVFKAIDPKVSRKSTYKEKSENSGSIYWVSASEKFVLYDKTDQLAYKEKRSNKIMAQLEPNMIRAEWRLLKHDTVFDKLKIDTPIDLLNAREDLNERFNRAWDHVLPPYKSVSTKKRKTSTAAIENEFDTQEATGSNKYPNDAILNLLLHAYAQSGDIDKFLKAQKGSYECNKRLNGIARKFQLNFEQKDRPSQIKLYDELRSKIFGNHL